MLSSFSRIFGTLVSCVSWARAPRELLDGGQRPARSSSSRRPAEHRRSGACPHGAGPNRSGTGSDAELPLAAGLREGLRVSCGDGAEAVPPIGIPEMALAGDVRLRPPRPADGLARRPASQQAGPQQAGPRQAGPRQAGSEQAGPGELRAVVDVRGHRAGVLTLRPDARGAAELTVVLAGGPGHSGVATAAPSADPGAASPAPQADDRACAPLALATQALLDWAFEALDLQAVHWRARVGDWSSRRVVWSVGFRLEGRVRSLVPVDAAAGATGPSRADAWVGSLLAQDPRTPASAWYDVPRLAAGGVVLRANRGDDAVRITEACAHPSTQRWLPALPAPYTLLDAAGFIASREEEHAGGHGISWCVANAADDTLLAQIALTGLDGGRSGCAEIGYWAHPQARGRGAVTTAVRLVARHALLPREDGGLGLDCVRLRAARGNTASQRVAERAGFRRSGVQRRAERLRDGSPEDFILFDLLPSELPPAAVHRPSAEPAR